MGRPIQWREALLEARKSSGEEGGFERFRALVLAAAGGGLDEAKALLATLTSQPEDNGEGEAVLSMLSTFDAVVRATAIVEELPRLIAQGEQDWADSIVETEARFHPAELAVAASSREPQAELSECAR